MCVLYALRASDLDHDSYRLHPTCIVCCVAGELAGVVLMGRPAKNREKIREALQNGPLTQTQLSEGCGIAYRHVWSALRPLIDSGAVVQAGRTKPEVRYQAHQREYARHKLFRLASIIHVHSETEIRELQRRLDRNLTPCGPRVYD